MHYSAPKLLPHQTPQHATRLMQLVVERQRAAETHEDCRSA
jgi:hypothetical protein